MFLMKAQVTRELNFHNSFFFLKLCKGKCQALIAISYLVKIKTNKDMFGSKSSVKILLVLNILTYQFTLNQV